MELQGQRHPQLLVHKDHEEVARRYNRVNPTVLRRGIVAANQKADIEAIPVELEISSAKNCIGMGVPSRPAGAEVIVMGDQTEVNLHTEVTLLNR